MPNGTTEGLEPVQNLRDATIRHEEMIGALGDELGALTRTVQALVDSQMKLNETTQTAISGAVTDMRKLVDGRAGADKNRMMSTIAIIVPVVLTIFSVLLMYSYSNSGRIEKLMENRVEQAYNEGRTVGIQISLEKKLVRLEQRLDDIHDIEGHRQDGN